MLIRAWRSARKAGLLSSGLHSRLVKAGGLFLVPLTLRSLLGRRGETLWRSGLLALLLVSCVASESSLEQVDFTDDGIRVSLSAPVTAGWLELQDETGKPLQRLPLPPGQRAPRLLYAWRSAQTYRFQLQTSQAGVRSAPILRQAPVKQPLRARLHLPYGQNVYALEPLAGAAASPVVTVPIPQDSAVTLGLELELLGEQPLQLSTALQVGEEQKPEAMLLEPLLPSAPLLRPGQPPSLSLHTLRLPAGERATSFDVRVEARGAARGAAEQAPLLYGLSVRLLPQALEGWQVGVKVTDWALPTSPKGELEAHREADVLVLPHPLWQKLGQGLLAGTLPFDPYQPVSWQRISFENRLAWPVTVLLKAKVLELTTGQELEAFVPRAFEVTGGLGQITTLARVPAHGKGQAVLPVYVRPEVREGAYQRRVEVQLLGLAEPLTVLEAPLYVRRKQPLLSGAVGLALGLSLLGVGVFLNRYRGLMKALGTRALTTIAMFGTLMFSVGFGMDMLTVGLNLLLGPLNVLVTGFLYEALHHLLLVALLWIYPRVGTVTLVGLTQYLMRGLTTGQLSPVDVLFVGSALVIKELSLWGVGITRGGLRAGAGPVDVRAVVQLWLALGMASGVSALLSLALHSALYRLFYADWYWWANLGVSVWGPLPGIWVGAKLGQELKRVRD